MKKIFASFLFITLSVVLFAQVPKVTTKVKTLGAINPGVILPINSSLTDTLKSTDTLFYKVQINHSDVGYPYISLLLKGGIAGTDTATVTVTFWQSVDGKTNWTQVLNTTSPTAWATSLTKAVQKAGGMDIDFWRSIAWFRSQFLGIRLICGTSASEKAIYYGSVRFDKY